MGFPLFWEQENTWGQTKKKTIKKTVGKAFLRCAQNSKVPAHHVVHNKEKYNQANKNVFYWSDNASAILRIRKKRCALLYAGVALHFDCFQPNSDCNAMQIQLNRPCLVPLHIHTLTHTTRHTYLHVRTCTHTHTPTKLLALCMPQNLFITAWQAKALQLDYGFSLKTAVLSDTGCGPCRTD